MSQNYHKHTRVKDNFFTNRHIMSHELHLSCKLLMAKLRVNLLMHWCIHCQIQIQSSNCPKEPESLPETNQALEKFINFPSGHTRPATRIGSNPEIDPKNFRKHFQSAKTFFNCCVKQQFTSFCPPPPKASAGWPTFDYRSIFG